MTKTRYVFVEKLLKLGTLITKDSLDPFDFADLIIFATFFFSEDFAIALYCILLNGEVASEFLS